MATTEPIPLLRAPEAAHAAPPRASAAREVLATLRARAVPLLLLVGIWLRAAQYLGNRSLWLDEALMLPIAARRTLAEILSPAGLGPIPIGFQLLTRILVTALGESEYVLRLVPFLAGIASLFLFLAVARRSLAPRAVPAALALFVFSPYLIYYASEFKPYQLDVVATLVLLLGALRIRARGLSRRGAVVAGVAGPAIVFFSLTGVFLLGGATLALIASAARRRDTVLLRRVLAIAAVWTVLVGVPAIILLAMQRSGGTGAQYLNAFWQEGFMPLPPRSLEDLAWFPKVAKSIFRDPMGVMTPDQSMGGFFQAGAGMALCLVGFASLAGRRRFLFAATAAMLGLALLASGLKAYPMGGAWVTGGRVVLYLVPVLILWMAHGMEQLRASADPGVRFTAVALFALALGPSVVQSVFALPTGRNEVRPLLEHARRSWRAGDVLYVHYEVKQPFAYYAPRLGFSEADYRIGRCSRFEPAGYLDQLDALRGRRVWVLFSNGTGAWEFDESGMIRDYLTRTGRKLDARVAKGASMYLFDLSGPRPATARDGLRLRKLPERIDQGCALFE
jgi:uncharacterized membrane protein